MAHSYYHADGNGNVTMLINASQTMAAKYLYDAFGNTLAQSGYLAAANTYRFSSKEWNANSGLYYYLYRFYDPNLQRWPNRDPLGELGFETLNFELGRLQNNLEMLKVYPSMRNLPLQMQAQKEIDILTKPAELDQGPSLYTFCHNNAITFIDPLGLKLTICDCNKFRSDMLTGIAQQAGADARVEWIRGGLTVTLAGGVGVFSAGGGLLVVGVGVGWSLYDIGNGLGERTVLAQNANRLYDKCIEQTTSQ
jgi:RHS repeat-associated protein